MRKSILLFPLLFSLTACDCLTQVSRIPTLLVSYDCEGGEMLVANFTKPHVAKIVIGRKTVSLPQARAASGFVYEDASYKLAGKGREIFWTEEQSLPVRCVLRNG